MRMSVDQDLSDATCTTILQPDLEQWNTLGGQQTLGQIISEWMQAGAAAGGEEEGFHFLDILQIDDHFSRLQKVENAGNRIIGISGHRVIGKPLEARSEKHLAGRGTLLFCVALFPLPGRRNDFFQRRVFRLPIHLAHDALWTRTKYCWISGPAFLDASRNFPADDFLDCAAHLAHGIGFSQADVVGAHSRLVHPAQRADVSPRDVNYVNVVAQTGTVGSFIIVAVNTEVTSLSGSSLE